MAQPMQVLRHQEFAPEVHQIAASHQLGTPKVEYGGHVSKWIIASLVIGVLFLVIGVVVALFGGPSSDGNPDNLITGSVFGLLGLIIAGYALIYVFVYRSWHVYICPEGYIFAKGKKIDVFPWNDIESMWQQVTRHYSYGIYSGTTHKYKVRRKDGVQVTFNDKFRDVESLGNTIAEEVTKRLLPQALASYNAGSTVPFGPLSVNLQGMSKGAQTVSWERIKNVDVKRGNVVVEVEGKLLGWMVPVAKVPNVFVLLALLGQVWKNK